MILPLLAVGFGLSALGGIFSSSAKARQARRNAALAEAAAADALQRGEQRAWQIQETSARRQGAQQLAFAHAGVDVASGSPAEIVSKTAMVGELDARIQRNNAFREAWGYRMQAASFRAAARETERAGVFNLFGAVFSAAGQFGGGGGGGGFSEHGVGGKYEGYT